MFDWYVFYTVMSVIFMSFMVLFSVAMIIIVALQEGNNNNLGAISGAAESFFGKNKAKSLEAKFKRLTIYISGAILLTSVLYFVMGVLRNRLPS